MVKDAKGRDSAVSTAQVCSLKPFGFETTQTDGDPLPKCHTGGGACLGEPPW